MKLRTVLLVIGLICCDVWAQQLPPGRLSDDRPEVSRDPGDIQQVYRRGTHGSGLRYAVTVLKLRAFGPDTISSLRGISS